MENWLHCNGIKRALGDGWRFVIGRKRRRKYGRENKRERKGEREAERQ